MHGNPPVHRINHNSSHDIRVCWHQDPAIDAILTRHGLRRYLSL
jgi:hypothetical protein